MKLHKSFKISSIILIIVLPLTFLFMSNSPLFQISKNLEILASIYKELNAYYVDETKPGELINIGIDAMLNSLDPYTVYYPESEIENVKFIQTGQYGGIGAIIRTIDSNIYISEPYENSPAMKSGLKAGDQILQIDGKFIMDKKIADISTILKGEPNSIVNLLIKRYGVEKSIPIEIKRKKIKINDVPYYGILEDKTGYIKLTGFTETASNEVKKAYENLKNNYNIKQLVLDLRNNGGGLLREAINVVNIFVDKNQEVVYTKGKLESWNHNYKTLNPALDRKIPLVILINSFSASASEIVSGALQDFDRAVIIGENSFGKGLVQQTRNLPYNTILKLTVSRYYIPSGRCIQKIHYRKKDSINNEEIEYKTKNGRIVYNKGGIEPDIKTKNEDFSQITFSLIRNYHIFNYTTKYANEHDSIPNAKEFHLTNEEYNDFVTWLKNKKYDYKTKTQELISELKKINEKEKYLNEEIEKKLINIKKSIEENKEKDLIKFKDEIKKILENEIISRYYYQKGRIQHSLNNDIEIKKAIELFHNKEMYTKILSPKK